jgi:hypothetical protein
MSLNLSDKERLLRRLECLDDNQLDRIESFVFGMEKRREQLNRLKRMRCPLKRNGGNMICMADVS